MYIGIIPALRYIGTLKKTFIAFRPFNDFAANAYPAENVTNSDNSVPITTLNTEMTNPYETVSFVKTVLKFCNVGTRGKIVIPPTLVSKLSFSAITFFSFPASYQMLVSKNFFANLFVTNTKNTPIMPCSRPKAVATE